MLNPGSNMISKVSAEEIKDSRGNPTIKVTVEAGDHSGRFSVPSGASTGEGEAKELRDKNGKGVQAALDKISGLIAPALVGKNVFMQREIDGMLLELDGTEDKSNLGGNSMIGVSIACAKAAAKAHGMEIFEYLRILSDMKPEGRVPYLYMNIINGGKHAQNGLAFQEYMIVPITNDPGEAVDMGMKIQQKLKEMISRELGEDSVIFGDEGGFAPKINDVRKPLEYLNRAIDEAGFKGRVKFALDVAATSFFEKGTYNVENKNISRTKLSGIYSSLVREFAILSIEDPFQEEDFDGFRALKEGHEGLLVVGDDLTVTNKSLVEKAMEKGSINAVIIKPNQIGTLSETLDAMRFARDNGIELIVSHRSGETDDDFIADLAYAFGCFGLKAGAPTKPERMIKYKRLMEIASK